MLLFHPLFSLPSLIFFVLLPPSVSSLSVSPASDPVALHVQQKYLSLASAASNLARSEAQSSVDTLAFSDSSDEVDNSGSSFPVDDCVDENSENCLRQSFARIVGGRDRTVNSLTSYEGRRKLDRIRKFLQRLRQLQSRGQDDVRKFLAVLNSTAVLSGHMAGLDSRMVGNLTFLDRSLNLDKFSTEKSVSRAVTKSNSLLRRFNQTHNRKFLKFSADQQREVVKADAAVRRLGDGKFLDVLLEGLSKRDAEIFHKIFRVDQETLQKVDKLGVSFDGLQAAISRFMAATVEEIRDKELSIMKNKLTPIKDDVIRKLHGNIRNNRAAFDKTLNSLVNNFQKYFRSSLSNHTKLVNSLGKELSKNISDILKPNFRVPNVTLQVALTSLPSPDFRAITGRLDEDERFLNSVLSRQTDSILPDYRGILRRAKLDVQRVIDKFNEFIRSALRDAKKAASELNDVQTAENRKLQNNQLSVSGEIATRIETTLQQLAEMKRKFDGEATEVNTLLAKVDLGATKQVGLIGNFFLSEMGKLNETLNSILNTEISSQEFPIPDNSDLADQFIEEIGNLQLAAQTKAEKYRSLMDATRISDSSSPLDDVAEALNTVDKAVVTIGNGVSNRPGNFPSEETNFRLANIANLFQDRIRKLRAAVDYAVQRENQKLSAPVSLALDLPSLDELDQHRKAQISDLNRLDRQIKDKLAAALSSARSEISSVTLESSLKTTLSSLLKDLRSRFTSDSTSLASATGESNLASRFDAALTALEGQISDSTQDLSIGLSDRLLVGLPKAVSSLDLILENFRLFPFQELKTEIETAQSLRSEILTTNAEIGNFNVRDKFKDAKLAIDRLHSLLHSFEHPLYHDVLMTELNRSLAAEAARVQRFIDEFDLDVISMKPADLNASLVSQQTEEDALINLRHKIDQFNNSLEISDPEFLPRITVMREVLEGLNTTSPGDVAPVQVLNATSIAEGLDLQSEIADFVNKSEMAVVSQAMTVHARLQESTGAKADAAGSVAEALGEVLTARDSWDLAAKKESVSTERADLQSRISEIAGIQRRAIADLLSVHQSHKGDLKDALDAEFALKQKIEETRRAMDAEHQEMLAAVQLGLEDRIETVFKQRAKVIEDVLKTMKDMENSLKTDRDLATLEMTRNSDEQALVRLEPLQTISERNHQILETFENSVKHQMGQIKNKADAGISGLRRGSAKHETAVDDAILRFMSSMRTAVSDTLSSLTQAVPGRLLNQ